MKNLNYFENCFLIFMKLFLFKEDYRLKVMIKVSLTVNLL